jgi:hypothetical protein
MDKLSLEVYDSEIRIVGIFEAKKYAKLAKDFIKEGFELENLSDSTRKFYKDYWYPEFRDLLFFKEKETSSKILKKTFNQSLTFIKNKDKEHKPITLVEAEIRSVELILFPNDLHFFSIELKPKENNIQQIADLIFCAREFNKELLEQPEMSWVNWIETNCLNGILITSNDVNDVVHTDGFSGSKFKLYTLVDFKENDALKNPQVRDELLYDLGCVSPIGTAGGDFSFTPSESYFEELLSDKISVFNNYTVLPLFDTFTVVGYNLLNFDDYGTKRSSWTQMYFRIYLYNLFIKYNLFRYNLDMEHDSVKVRDEFESFLNTYNLSHISYNFLPNLIFHQHRKSLQIDEELDKFQERINRISQAIQEEQQKRSNLLLGIVGAMTSISSVKPILDILENTRTQINLNGYLFYSLAGIIALTAAIPLLAYLFPEKKKQLLRKWKNRKK